jgi:hypothetical protein
MKKAMLFRDDDQMARVLPFFPDWEGFVEGDLVEEMFDLIMVTYEPRTSAVASGWAYIKKIEGNLTPDGELQFFD